MTSLHILRRTFANFYREHTTLMYVLIGMIGVPLVGAAVLGMMGVVLWALISLFGNLIGVLLFIFSAMGAIGGFVVAKMTQEAEND